jgi:hypothetical protein
MGSCSVAAQSSYPNKWSAIRKLLPVADRGLVSVWVCGKRGGDDEVRRLRTKKRRIFAPCESVYASSMMAALAISVRFSHKRIVHCIAASPPSVIRLAHAAPTHE